MQPTMHFVIRGNRLEIRAGSRMAKGLTAAAIRYGWLKGENLPRSAKAAERAAWAAWRVSQAQAKSTAS
jgi:hypothetical protein